MLEDRIIVQDRGIDAGLAALMQNANKGMDPAAMIRTNKEKKLQLNAMKKWLSVRLYQISWEQIMNQLERMIKYQNYRKKLVS